MGAGAKPLQLAVLEARTRLLGSDHPDTVDAMSNLAGIYRRMEQCQKAVGLELSVLEARKRVLGSNHLETLGAMSNLALSYCIQERWAEAEKMQLAVLETRKRQSRYAGCHERPRSNLQ